MNRQDANDARSEEEHLREAQRVRSIVCLLLLAGCGAESRAEELGSRPACKSARCAKGSLCIARTDCYRECTATSECATGETCVTTEGRQPKCPSDGAYANWKSFHEGTPETRGRERICIDVSKSRDLWLAVDYTWRGEKDEIVIPEREKKIRCGAASCDARSECFREAGTSVCRSACADDRDCPVTSFCDCSSQTSDLPTKYAKRSSCKPRPAKAR